MHGVENEAAARLVLDCVDVAMMLIARDNGEILYANQKLSADVGVPLPEVIGQHYESFFWDDFLLSLQGLLARCEAGGPCDDIYHWAERAFWGQRGVQLATLPGGRQVFVLSITNITEVSRLQLEYRRMAYYDHLLDLPNGNKLEEDIKSLQSFNRCALIHFDIRHFGNVNDLYGWGTGDALLTQVRDWLLKTLRTTSRLYRIGADEFCLLIRDIALDDAKGRAGEILQRFSHSWALPAGGQCTPIYCSVDMGVVYGNFVQEDIRSLLYRTTHSSPRPEGFTLYDAELDRRYKERLLLRQSLVNCIQQNMQGFAVHYQPIVEAQTGRWVGAEALCRWVWPQHGPIPPPVFIREVEHLGMITHLDNWVLRTAVESCSAWGLCNKTFFLDVNISPLIAMDDEYTRGLLALLQQSGFPSHQLSVEVTESAKVDFDGPNMRHLEELSRAGVTIALDDFGTGYSSFNNLVKLPAQVLKTEKAFIDNLEQDEYMQYLVQMLVNLAHTAGMKIISEGVETPGQRDLLRSYGVDYLQGYLFSKPLPADAFAARLDEYTGTA